MALPLDLIQLLRGWYIDAASAVGVLADGEPAKYSILKPDNTVFEMLWLGGHDGVNHLLGGGFQLTSGMPQFAAPVGAALLDPNTCTIWVSTSFTGGGSGSGIGSGIGSGSGFGQWCPISENGGGGGGGIEEIDTQTPILGGPITAGETGTISHAISGVTPGSFTNANITVNEWGHVTLASSGSGGGVTSVDSISGAITLVAGSNITIANNTPSAGDITISATGHGGGVDVQTISGSNLNYTIPVSDLGKLVIAENNGPFTATFTLPQTTTQNPSSGAGASWYVDIQNSTTNPLTLTTQGSAVIYIDGYLSYSSIPIPTNCGGRVYCDGTYFYLQGGSFYPVTTGNVILTNNVSGIGGAIAASGTIFRLSIYLLCPTTDTNGSSVSAKISWTDAVQAQSFTTSSITLSQGNYLQTSVVIEGATTGVISWLTIITGSNTSGAYSMYLVLEQLI